MICWFRGGCDWVEITWGYSGRRSRTGTGTSPWKCLCNHYRGRRPAAGAICISARSRNHQNNDLYGLSWKIYFHYGFWHWKNFSNRFRNTEVTGGLPWRCETVQNATKARVVVQNVTKQVVNFKASELWCFWTDFRGFFTIPTRKKCFLTYEQTSWCMACSKCCVLTIALIFPAEFDAQYGVTISVLLSQASTRPLSELWFALKLLLCLDFLNLLKYDSPTSGFKTGSIPGSAWRSGTPGLIFSVSLFAFRPPPGPGPYSGPIWKSPYILFIKALFSSMNSSMRLLENVGRKERSITDYWLYSQWVTCSRRRAEQLMVSFYARYTSDDLPSNLQPEGYRQRRP